MGNRKKYADPKITLDGFTKEELEANKWVILEVFAAKLSREDACKAGGITLRELKLLESSDSEFKKRIEAIVAGDDAILVDLARKNIKELLKSETDGVRRAMTTYVMDRKGGWAPQTNVKVEDKRTNSDPVDYSQFDKKPSLKMVD